MTRDQMEWFVLWNDTFDDEGFFLDSDAEIAIIDRAKLRGYQYPDQSKDRSETKGEKPKKA